MSYNGWANKETFNAKKALDNEWGDINIIKRGSKLTPRIIEQLMLWDKTGVDFFELSTFYSNLRESYRHA